MNEEIKLPINLMIDTVFNNYNDDTELLARWLFKNGYINKNEDGNYIKNKDYKSIFINSKYEEVKEYVYCFKQMQQQLQAYKDKEDKLREHIKQNILWLDSIDNQVYTIYGYNSDRIAIVEVDELLQILKERYEK